MGANNPSDEGVKIATTTGRPSSTRATGMQNSGSPLINALIPSIGSITQMRRFCKRAGLSGDSFDSHPSSGKASNKWA